MNSKLENHVKKSYNSPQLVIYGGIRDLTKTTSDGPFLDCHNDASPPPPICDFAQPANMNRSGQG